MQLRIEPEMLLFGLPYALVGAYALLTLSLCDLFFQCGNLFRTEDRQLKYKSLANSLLVNFIVTLTITNNNLHATIINVNVIKSHNCL